MTTFAVRLDHPWEEPSDPPLAAPTSEQLGAGVVVVIKVGMVGRQKLIKGERYLMSRDTAQNFLADGFVRLETEREERIAKAEGHARPSRMDGKRKAAKPKKAEDASGG